MARTKRSPAQLRLIFGDNLRYLARDYASVSELCRQLGINRTQFNRYLSGESFPRPDVLDRICSFFGKDARILLEPVTKIPTGAGLFDHDVLRDYHAPGVLDLTESEFPSGLYVITRQHSAPGATPLRQPLYVFRQDGFTFARCDGAFTLGHALPRPKRELRGYAVRRTGGVLLVMSARTGGASLASSLTRQSGTLWHGHEVGGGECNQSRAPTLRCQHAGTWAGCRASLRSESCVP